MKFLQSSPQSEAGGGRQSESSEIPTTLILLERDLGVYWMNLRDILSINIFCSCCPESNYSSTNVPHPPKRELKKIMPIFHIPSWGHLKTYARCLGLTLYCSCWHPYLLVKGRLETWSPHRWCRGGYYDCKSQVRGWRGCIMGQVSPELCLHGNIFIKSREGCCWLKHHQVGPSRPNLRC